MRGEGFLYQRRAGGTWWACFWRDGKRVRESLRTADKELAQTRLGHIRRSRERGTYLSPGERRVRVDELLDDLLRHLELRGVGVATARSHAKAVREVLGHERAATLDTSRLEEVQAGWIQAHVAAATVNRRFELLRQALNLASRRSPPKIRLVPHVPMLKLQNARQGFLSRADFEAIAGALEDPDLRDFVEWAWWTGMRRGESAKLTWEMFDRETWTLRLHASAEKARLGRVLALEGPLRRILERRLEARLLEAPWIFHRAGARVGEFRAPWSAAAAAAGLPGVLFHDLRRSAIRNMVRSGVDPSVAMKISGHRTRATFDRYNIVDVEDLRDAVLRTEAYVSGLPRQRKVAAIGASRGSQNSECHSVADGKKKGRRGGPGGLGSR